MRIAVIGATGQIGTRLVASGLQAGHEVVGISRHRPTTTSADWRSVDAEDPEALTVALRGADAVVTTLGLRYDIATWRDRWVPLTRSVVDAARGAGTALLWLDNCYPYGLPGTPITEQTPIAPRSRMGAVRAEVHEVLRSAAEQLPITVARAADFLGPGVETTLVPWSSLVRASRPGPRRTRLPWIGDPDTSHQYASADEVSRALLTLAEHDPDGPGALTTWILPALAPVTGRDLCTVLARLCGHAVTALVLPQTLLRVVGGVSPLVRASNDMAYLSRHDFLVDDTRFRTAFDWGPVGTVAELLADLRGVPAQIGQDPTPAG
ncbi:NAD-dependent epimerase/dehydratase family protein [Raineyella fluvialis]|uniref:NAD-dependent epimerase/dehydratase family protein n=1 Tax=Raineyella fluvialis TaxID=2662261 RepID=A0A5Q2FAY7_9ACTN|nr:NAD-dependent epimerase/dehydratase family protein [Raineyella fluvialis]QGF24180.1 NAD-dependent epimerase/dehydratase family protein [Raineyella fluvialis]